MRKNRRKNNMAFTAVCFVFLAAVLSIFPAARALSQDAFEFDGDCDHATFVNVDAAAQHHDFHAAADVDWIYFRGLAGQIYNIEIDNVGSQADPAIELRDSDCLTILAEKDYNFEGEGESLTWQDCDRDSYYFVKIHCADCVLENGDAGYDIAIWTPAGPEGRLITVAGTVSDPGGTPLEGADVFLHDSGGNELCAAPTLDTGEYTCTFSTQNDYADTCPLSARLVDCHADPVSITIMTGVDIYEQDIQMSPTPADCRKGDVNSDGRVLLEDVKLAYQYLVLPPENDSVEFCATNVIEDGSVEARTITMNDVKGVFDIFAGAR